MNASHVGNCVPRGCPYRGAATVRACVEAAKPDNGIRAPMGDATPICSPLCSPPVGMLAIAVVTAMLLLYGLAGGSSSPALVPSRGYGFFMSPWRAVATPVPHTHRRTDARGSCGLQVMAPLPPSWNRAARVPRLKPQLVCCACVRCAAQPARATDGAAMHDVVMSTQPSRECHAM